MWDADWSVQIGIQVVLKMDGDQSFGKYQSLSFEAFYRVVRALYFLWGQLYSRLWVLLQHLAGPWRSYWCCASIHAGLSASLRCHSCCWICEGNFLLEKRPSAWFWRCKFESNPFRSSQRYSAGLIWFMPQVQTVRSPLLEIYSLLEPEIC